MNHSDFQDRLNDYADGTLPEAERHAADTHLALCETCRTEVEQLQTLLAEAHDLPRAITPPRDLWPEIAARIEGGKMIEVDFQRRDRIRVSGRLLAAAAVILVVASSLVTAVLVRAPGGTSIVSLPPEQGASSDPVVTAFAAFQPAEQEYIQTVEELEATLDAGRDILAPETIATIEENLRIIDQAIAESRAALEADPNNRELTDMLSGVYKRKVELLHSAVLLQSQT